MDVEKLKPYEAHVLLKRYFYSVEQQWNWRLRDQYIAIHKKNVQELGPLVEKLKEKCKQIDASKAGRNYGRVFNLLNIGKTFHNGAK